MSAPTLLVPIEVRALAVNTQTLALPFRRWRFNYESVNLFESPEPGPFAGEIDDSFDSPSNAGVWLHWISPKGLRHGVHAGAGEVDYPMLPNRWLIVRLSGSLDAPRSARAWVVESDCPNQSDAGHATLYVVDQSIVDAWRASADPRRSWVPAADPNGPAHVVPIGDVFDLPGWTETGIDEQFLTAVAPGNPLYTGYLWTCNGMFTLQDPLVEDGIERDTLSYLVAGWYSVPDCDPVTQAQGSSDPDAYAQRLEALGWTVLGDPTDEATRSVFHGMVYGLDWDDAGEARAPSQDLHVALGSSSADAFATLIGAQLAASATSNSKLAELTSRFPAMLPRVLEAFQHGLLDELGKPGGRELVDQKLRQSWFQSMQGGVVYELEDTTDDADADAEVPTASELEAERSWLPQLNAAQAEFDAQLAELRRLQWQLYAAWWKAGLWPNAYPFGPPSDVTITLSDIEANLEPTSATSLPAAVRAQLEVVAAAAAALPTPDPSADTPEAAFAQGLQDYAAAKRAAGQLSAQRQLRAAPRDHFWRCTDPSLLIAGAGANPGASATRGPLGCRLDSQVVTGITTNAGASATASDLAAMIPTIDTSVIGDVFQRLLDELYFLDPNNAATMVGALTPTIDAAALQAELEPHEPVNFQGTLPDLPLAEWTPPWAPLYIEWTLNWYDLPLLDPDSGAPNWSFDGQDYRYTAPPPSAPSSVQFGGRATLTRQTVAVFQNRLEDYVRAHPDRQLASELDGFIASVDAWDFVAQNLVGTNQQLQRLDPRANRGPDDSVTFTFADATTLTLTELVGGAFDHAPFLPTSPPPFTGLRAGQLALAELIVYDSFGQTIDVVDASGGLTSPELFAPLLSSNLRPDQPIEPTNAQRFVELRPRLLQAARLAFELVDAIDGLTPAGPASEVDPIGGWLLANHLDHSLMLFTARGDAAGELLATQGTSARAVSWQPSPGSPLTTLDAVRAASPRLGDVASALVAAGVASFDAFLATIDATLWTIDPLGARSDRDLTALVGRPLALVATTLALELDGPPITDTGLDATLEPPPPPFIDYPFEVRLGDRAMREDGLIGYFLGGVYTTFNAVVPVAPSDSTDYLAPVTTGNFITLRVSDASPAQALLLVDPRASVHAISGILPLQTLTVPSRLSAGAIAQMEVSFRAAPILTQLQNGDGDGETETAITLPAPAEQGGTWAWWEASWAEGETAWTSLPIVNVDASAQLRDIPTSLRDGLLQLRKPDPGSSSGSSSS